MKWKCENINIGEGKGKSFVSNRGGRGNFSHFYGIESSWIDCGILKTYLDEEEWDYKNSWSLRMRGQYKNFMC